MSYTSSPEELREMINRGAGTLNLGSSGQAPGKGGPSAMTTRNPNIKYT